MQRDQARVAAADSVQQQARAVAQHHGQVAVLPARALRLQAGGVDREFAGDDSLRAEHGRLARASKIETKAQIFDQVGAGQRCIPDQRPREGHAATHQLARQAKARQAERAAAVLDGPSEFRDPRLEAWLAGRLRASGTAPAPGAR
ncbi:hypothetical protein LP420_06820 [Massilia sp. B-10]|nr:hypothetical protein LP420_06820 [Massilia sp. B-10]